MEMNKRVYGIIGISAIMSNWNADFSGSPKTISDGSIFGSDKALKYPMKKMWENQGEKVVYIKSFKIAEDKKKLNPRSLAERYQQLFGKEVKNSTSEEVARNLFTAIDVKNFGATFAAEDNNISIAGAVQIGQGFNKYADSMVEEQQILSPFRDDKKEKTSNAEEAKNSTLGTKIVSDEAHYMYPFNINPQAYRGYAELGLTQGYTEEDYERFKETATVAVTSYATNSKVGCENELAVFVETKEEVYLPNLSEYVLFEKGKKGCITLTFDELLNELGDSILGVEIYYNPYKVELKHQIKGAKSYNIFTKKEV